MSYGELLAKTFDTTRKPLAQQTGGQRQQAAPAQSGGPDFKGTALEKAPENLQFTGNLAQKSRQIYADWADLQSYAKTMWLKYGVNVLAPDPGDDSSVYAADAFTQRLGQLMASIGEAQRGAKLEETVFAPAFVKGEATATPEFSQQFAGSAPAYQISTPTKVLPTTQEYIDKMTGVLNITPSQAKTLNEQDKGQLINHYQQKIAEDPANAKLYQNQIDLLQTVKAVPAENAPDRSGFGVDNTSTMVKEYALLTEGSQRYFQLPDNPQYTKEGRPLYEAYPTGWVGSAFGQKRQGANKGKPFVIAKVLHDYGDPNNAYDGATFFEDAEGERIPADKRNISTGVRTLVESNRGMYSLSDLNKFFSKYGSDIVPSYRVLDETESQQLIADQSRGKQYVAQTQPVVKAAIDYFTNQLDQLGKEKPRSFAGLTSIAGFNFGSTPVLEGDTAKIPLVSGQTLNIKKGSEPGTYKIDNYTTLFPREGKEIQVGNRTYDRSSFTKLSKDQLLEIANYLGLDISQAPTTQPITGQPTTRDW